MTLGLAPSPPPLPTPYRHAVARDDRVAEVVVGVERHCLRRLSLGDGVWRLLKLDELLVRVRAAVVHQAHGVLAAALQQQRQRQ